MFTTEITEDTEKSYKTLSAISASSVVIKAKKQEFVPVCGLIKMGRGALETLDSPDIEQIGHVYENSLAGSVRRETGTHYTPKPLAEEIVCATLTPLVSGRTPQEILSLKICDPAMGSGAFLIAACRWLGERLLQSQGREISRQNLAGVMRLVAQYCLYGVDIDPVAVELARLSIKLLTQSNKAAPQFLERNFRTGDSLSAQPLFPWEDCFPDVFRRVNPGFDAIIGNPPFLGGRKMRGVLGNEYLKRLKAEWSHASLNADLCSFFLLRASTLVRKEGQIGFLASNTIAQGDTAKTGLVFLTERSNFTIRQAVPSFHWPGQATVVASWVVLQNGPWNDEKRLNNRSVRRISPILDEGGNWGTSRRLPENEEIHFQGSVLAGEGFVLTEKEAEDFLSIRPANSAVIFPYLGGREVNSSPIFAPKRWVIDFRDFPLEQCEQEWPELLEQVRRLVKPHRDRANRAPHRRYWWHHGDKRPALYARIRKNKSVFVLTRHTKHLALAQVSTQQVFQESLCVLDLPNWTAFAAIQSTIHEIWARRGSSTLGEGLRYTPTDYFETFPFLHLQSKELEETGKRYYDARQNMLIASGQGFTVLYNHFHSPQETVKSFQELRELRRRMDEAVCAAYGWDDLKLDHGFYEIVSPSAKDRTRFTISEPAQAEILRRLFFVNPFNSAFPEKM